MAYECTGLEVYLAPDIEHRPMSREGFDHLLTLDVGELLAINVAMPSYAAIHTFTFDLKSLGDHWKQHDVLPEAWPSPQATTMVCGRHFHSLAAIWMPLDEGQHRTLTELPRDQTFTLNDLAAVYLEQCAAADSAPATQQDEQAMFDAFFAFLIRCLESGVLLQRDA